MAAYSPAPASADENPIAIGSAFRYDRVYKQCFIRRTENLFWLPTAVNKRDSSGSPAFFLRATAPA